MQARVIRLPNGNRLNGYSKFIQVSHDCFEFIGGSRQILVNKITNRLHGRLLFTRFASIGRPALEFALAVYHRRSIIISGGFEQSRNESSRRVSILDLKSHDEEDAPDLNQARHSHSSMVLGDYLYAMGGSISSTQCSGSIECLNMIQR